MDQKPARINHKRQLNTLDEVALRILCACLSADQKVHPHPELALNEVKVSYMIAETFMREAERRNASGWEGE